MPAEKNVCPAPFGPRAAAFLVDRALLAAALLLVRIPAWAASLFAGAPARSFLFDHSFADVLCWLLSALYFILLTYFTGGTLGKKLMRVRVAAADGKPLRLVDVIYRETIGRFLSGIMYIGYFMALVDREHRAFHDWLCGTCVVSEPAAARAESAVPAAGERGAEAVPAPALAPAGTESAAAADGGPAETDGTPVPAVTEEAPEQPEGPAAPETGYFRPAARRD